jgi:hypothetical protein
MNLPRLVLTGLKLGIEHIRNDALKDIQLKLTMSNIAKEMFTSFAAKWVEKSCSVHSCLRSNSFSHTAVMDLETQFLLENFTERNPKLLMEHIQRMASGETPFLPGTLSLIYGKLIDKFFVQSTSTGSTLGKSTETGGQSAAEPASATQVPNSTPRADPTPSPVPSPSTQESKPEFVPLGAVWLQCFQCGERARMRDLYNGGARCPRCPSRSRNRGRPFMQCPSCNLIRTGSRNRCLRRACQAIFV